MSETRTADDERRGMEKGWINFKRPLDINTVITLVAFICGGMFFVSDVKARLDLFTSQFQSFQSRTDSQIDRITARIDTMIDGKR